MKLLQLLGLELGRPHELPAFVRELRDIQSVRVIRLQGSVGKEIGKEADEADEAAAKGDAFERAILFDFRGATDCDSLTIAYMVRALRRRMAAHAQVGIINAPQQLLAELEIAKLKGMFRIFDSEQEAITALATSKN